jgi:hypothetical protein
LNEETKKIFNLGLKISWQNESDKVEITKIIIIGLPELPNFNTDFSGYDY